MDRLLAATRRAEHDHFWFRGFRRFVQPILEAALGERTQPSILDAGCGTGANLPMLDRHGRAIGIDLTWAGLQFAREQGLQRIGQASVTDLPFRDDAFDLVTSFDVLYCLEDRSEHHAVAEMFRVLKPGGAAIVNVAALKVLRGGQSVLGGEVRRYTRRRLRDVLERHGFRIERLTYTNATLFPLILAVRLGQRATGLAERARESDLNVPPRLINEPLSGLLGIEARLLRWFDMPIGSSVLCLARKPAGPTP
jgi:SAM-dependent methyltransferase